MVNLFTKLPGFTKTPAGKERNILRLIPKVLVVGSVLIMTPSLIVRLGNMDQAPWMINKLITTIDIYAFGLLSVLWGALFAIGVGALTVMIMKGPAYVADAYPLPDADKPADHNESSKPAS